MDISLKAVKFLSRNLKISVTLDCVDLILLLGLVIVVLE